MESPLQKRRRILLLFLLGVGMPSLGLGYLAVRGIRNELALLQQRSLAEHRVLSQRVTDTLATGIRAAEEAVARAAAQSRPAEGAASQADMSGVGATHPLVEEVFLLDSLGAIHLPWARLLYLSDGFLSPLAARPWPSAAGSQLLAARRLEFQRRDYAQALAGYRRAFSAASDPAHRGEALLAMARVQRKAGQARAALAMLEVLAGEFVQVRTATGLPLGPNARIEGASLLAAEGDSAAALEAFASLYRDLVEGTWALERGEYQFLAGQARDLVETALARLPPGTPRDSLRSAVTEVGRREAEAIVETERLLLFQAIAGSQLTARVPAPTLGALAPGIRVTLEGAGESFLVAVPNQAAGPGGIVGLILDAEHLADLVGGAFARLADPATTEWVLRGRDGGNIRGGGGPPTGPTSLNLTFPDNFPPWLLELRQRPQSAVRLLFASSRSVYSYMFLLIGTILAFGLVLTVRTVSHELELARLKSDFLSTVSHEFRSPLTSIRHVAEMLQAGSVPSEERRRRYYDVLVEQSTRLSSLVTNILDLARIEEGKQEFRFAAVDPGDLVRELVAGVRQRVQHDGFLVEAKLEEPLPPLRADRVALTQALSNLLDNAIRYSGASKRIEVRASADGTHLTLAVTDQGVGIPVDEQGKVFDRFFRGGSPLTRSVKGSGLGLTLVKEIVEAHGGTVHLQSEVGRGSTFSIRLPLMSE